MLAGTCHCEAVRVEVPRRPRMLTNCNCSICRRYGVLWAYYKASDVRVIGNPGATNDTLGRRALNFVRCTTCGNTSSPFSIALESFIGDGRAGDVVTEVFELMALIDGEPHFGMQVKALLVDTTFRGRRRRFAGGRL